MKIKRLVTSMLSVSLLFGAGIASAENQETNVMTRGEFAQAIVEQLAIEPQNPTTALPSDLDESSPFANSVKVLKERQVVQGYPDGTFQAAKPISKQEAMWLLARIWRVDAERVPHILEEDYGVNVDQVMDRDQGLKLIENFFATDETASDLVTKTTEAQLEQTSFRSAVSQQNVMEFKEPITENGTNLMEMESQAMIEFHKTDGFFLKSVTKAPNPTTNEPMEITMEQYLVKDGMYMKMNNPQTGEEQWVKMGDAFPISFEQMMEMQKNSLNLNQSLLNKHVFYKDLGTETVNGAQLHKLAYRMSFGSFKEMMDVVSNSMPDLAKLPMEMENIGASLSMDGYIWIDPSSFLPVQFEQNMKMDFQDQMADQPIKTIQMHQVGTYSDFNEVESIVLPEAAKNAETLPMPQENQ